MTSQDSKNKTRNLIIYGSAFGVLFSALTVIGGLSIYTVGSAAERFEKVIVDGSKVIKDKKEISNLVEGLVKMEKESYIVIKKSEEDKILDFELHKYVGDYAKMFADHETYLNKKDNKETLLECFKAGDGSVSYGYNDNLAVEKISEDHPIFSRGFFETIGSIVVHNLCYEISRFSNDLKSCGEKLIDDPNCKILIITNDNKIFIGFHAHDGKDPKNDKYDVFFYELNNKEKEKIDGRDFLLVYFNSLFGLTPEPVVSGGDKK